MLSISETFRHFIDWLVARQLINKESIGIVLAEFGGVDGVIENEYYISAYEELARFIAKKWGHERTRNLLLDSHQQLSVCPEHSYYFIEALIDESLSRHGNVVDLIRAAPLEYQVYLNRRFKS